MELPALPKLDPKLSIPYEAMRRTYGYDQSTVHAYMTDYLQAEVHPRFEELERDRDRLFSELTRARQEGRKLQFAIEEALLELSYSPEESDAVKILKGALGVHGA